MMLKPFTLGLRAEARTRAIGSGFDRKATELTVGVSK
jgi:hypothetical protein